MPRIFEAVRNRKSILQYKLKKIKLCYVGQLHL